LLTTKLYYKRVKNVQATLTNVNNLLSRLYHLLKAGNTSDDLIFRIKIPGVASPFFSSDKTNIRNAFCFSL